MSGEQRRMGGAQGPGPAAQQKYRMQLYKDYYEQVRRYFARHVDCPQDVDDLVQTVFLNLMANTGAVRNPRRYVQAAARHQLYAYWRQKRARLDIEQTVSAGEGGYAADGEQDWDPLELLSGKEMRQVVDSMMARLSPTLAEALRLRFVHGLPPDEAAAQAGCSREALKKRVKRARHSLAEFLAPGGDRPG
jgi:RNA polymerase sigma factor (sigma-70 family)